MHIAETERLALRHLVPADAAFLCGLLNEPSWLQNIGDRGVRTAQDAERYIQDKFIGSYAALGYGMYLTELKGAKIPIGLCGLIRRGYLPGPDIGFAYLPPFWGNGYAFEAAAAIMRYAHDGLGLAKLLAIVKPDNVRSMKLLARLGFSPQGECRVPATDELVSLYASMECPPQMSAAGTFAVRIRPAAEADAIAIAQAHYSAVHGGAAGTYPARVLDIWAPTPCDARFEVFRRAVRGGRELFLIAEETVGVIGFGSIIPSSNELRSVYVHADHAHRGVGSAILDALEVLAVAKGCSDLEFNASLNAEPFYVRNGYMAVARGTQQLSADLTMACVTMRKRLRRH